MVSCSDHINYAAACVMYVQPSVRFELQHAKEMVVQRFQQTKPIQALHMKPRQRITTRSHPKAYILKSSNIISACFQINFEADVFFLSVAVEISRTAPVRIRYSPMP